ncbi:MAG: heterodisulfide reductase-related iron-sulfur binding cluster [Bacteroidales bacterium]
MYFKPFVLPFAVGVLFFFAVLIYKFVAWHWKYNKTQRRAVYKNLFTVRTLEAIWEAIREGLLHNKIWRTNPVLGYMHSSIALGWFLLIVVSKFESWLYFDSFISRPWMGIFYRYFAIDGHRFWAEDAFNFVMDFLLLYVLSGVTLAFIKRFYSRLMGMKKTTKHILYDKFALTSLWFIFPLRLFAESATAAIHHNGGFATQWIGDLMSLSVAQMVQLPLWWGYSIALFIFLVNLPFSRYMHIPAEIALIFSRRWGVNEMDFTTGYTKLEVNACSRCGICIDVCPLQSEANINHIQAAYFIRDVRYHTLTGDTAQNCLMCNRCVAACPVGIESTLIRQEYRAQTKIDKHGNYKFIDTFQSRNSIGHIIYFAGCMTHLTPSIIESMKSIFKEAGDSYWFMDEDQSVCCGRPLKQQGFFKQAYDLRTKNTELINKSGAKTLVVSCPICYQSFKKEYGLKINILHHSQYIQQLLDSGKIQVNKSASKVSYHDPCELGRACGEYEASRKVLAHCASLIEAPKNKKDSLCCGYNLGDAVLDLSDQMKVRDAALKNLLTFNPDSIVTACPMCKKAFMHGNKQKVQDLAEIVAENLLHKQKLS